GKEAGSVETYSYSSTYETRGRKKSPSGTYTYTTTTVTTSNYTDASAFTYDANGNEKSERDSQNVVTNVQTTYANYSPNYGMTYVTNTSSTIFTPYENATASYDALNRLISYGDTGYNNSEPANITYQYDANGNVRAISATYKDAV